MTDIPGNASTTKIISGTGYYAGSFEMVDDSDWWRIHLIEGRTYSFAALGTGDQVDVDVKDATGADLTGPGFPWSVSLTPTQTGIYYVNVSNKYNVPPVGDYTLGVWASDMIGGTRNTAGVIKAGQEIASAYEAVGDRDMFVFNAEAGVTYELTLSNPDPGAMTGQWLYPFGLEMSHGIEEILGMGGSAATVTYTATTSGPQYVRLKPWANVDIGSYTFSLRSDARDVIGTGANDTLSGMDNDNFIATGAGDDVLNGNGGNDTLRGGEGNDLLNGGTGLDIADYSGGSGPMQVNLSIAGAQNTGWGNDTLVSVEGILGGAGNDRLNGNNLANTLSGAGGNDFIFGAAGDDILLGGYGHDTINGGDGTDTLIFSAASATQVDLLLTGAQWTGQGTDIIRNVEYVQGGAGNDRYSGSDGDNILLGMAGNDALAGRAGNDRLNGGDGSDRLFGGAGNDVLIGGAGADTFVFFSGSGLDQITDFQQGADRIEFISGAESYADLLIRQAGTAVEVSYGRDKIVLADTNVAAMESSDFLFT